MINLPLMANVMQGNVYECMSIILLHYNKMERECNACTCLHIAIFEPGSKKKALGRPFGQPQGAWPFGDPGSPNFQYEAIQNIKLELVENWC